VQKQREDVASKEFLTVKEVAKKLGVHWYTVWRWTMENRIKFKQVKAGCKILIPASELLQFQSPSE
jgi:excisionase family DNA binding protein